MIHTFSTAEQLIPPGLAAEGQKSWHWVEFGLNVPYFLLRYVFTDSDDLSYTRHILTHDVGIIIEKPSSQSTKLESVSLLSPGYVNGTADFCLDRLAEIWAADEKCLNPIEFVFWDGRRRRFDLTGEEGESTALRMIANFM